MCLLPVCVCVFVLCSGYPFLCGFQRETNRKNGHRPSFYGLRKRIKKKTSPPSVPLVGPPASRSTPPFYPLSFRARRGLPGRLRGGGPRRQEPGQGLQPPPLQGEPRHLPSAERRAPSAERRAPSAERRAPSAERRAPSAERRAQTGRWAQWRWAAGNGSHTCCRDEQIEIVSVVHVWPLFHKICHCCHRAVVEMEAAVMPLDSWAPTSQLKSEPRAGQVYRALGNDGTHCDTRKRANPI